MTVDSVPDLFDFSKQLFGIRVRTYVAYTALHDQGPDIHPPVESVTELIYKLYTYRHAAYSLDGSLH